MKVMWIASVLLFGVIAYGINSYLSTSYPKQDAAQSLAIITDPFAEEVFSDTSITLAVLPDESGNRLRAGGNGNNNDAANKVSQQQPQEAIIAGVDYTRSTKTRKDSSDLTSADVALVDATTLSEGKTSGKRGDTAPMNKSDHNAFNGDNASLAEVVDAKSSGAKEVTMAKAAMMDNGRMPVPQVDADVRLENASEKIAIIVNASNKQGITKAELKKIYMRHVSHWRDGSKIMPFNLPLGDKWREKFSQRVLNMSALEADLAESNRMSDGRAPMSGQVKAKNIIVSYIERNPNAIAYVPLSVIKKNSQVRVLMTLP